jgi:hypothetical protein
MNLDPHISTLSILSFVSLGQLSSANLYCASCIALIIDKKKQNRGSISYQYHIRIHRSSLHVGVGFQFLQKF